MIVPVFDELKGLLRQSGYSVKYICWKTGIHKKTIYELLNGRVFMSRVDTMLRLAHFLRNHDVVLTENVRKMVEFYPAPEKRRARSYTIPLVVLRMR